MIGLSMNCVSRSAVNAGARKLRWQLQLAARLRSNEKWDPVPFATYFSAPAAGPADYDILLHGHTHVPRDETIGRRSISEPGLCHTAQSRRAAERRLA